MSDPMSGSARDKLDRINKSMRTTMTKFHLPQILLPKLGAVKDEVVEKDYQGEGEMEGLGAVMHLRSHVKGSLHAPGTPMHVPAPTQDVEKSGTENFPVSSLAMRMSPLNVNGDASELAEKDSEASKKAWESRQRAKEEGAAEKPAAEKPQASPGKWKQTSNRVGEAGIRLYDANSKLQNRIVLGVPYEYPDSPEGKKDKGYHKAFDIIYGSKFREAVANASFASKKFYGKESPPTDRELNHAREKAQTAKDMIQPLKAALKSSPKGDRILPTLGKIESDLDSILSSADALSGRPPERDKVKVTLKGDWTPKDEKRANDEAARIKADEKKHGEREAQLRHRGRMGRMADAIGDPGKAEGRARKFGDAGMAEAATLFADRANQLRRQGKESKAVDSPEDIAEEMQYDLWLKAEGESSPEVSKVHPQIIDSDADRSEAAHRAWEKRGRLQPDALSPDDMKLRQAGMDWFKKMKSERGATPGTVTRSMVASIKGLTKDPEITPLYHESSHVGTVESANRIAQQVKNSLRSVGYTTKGEMKMDAHKGSQEIVSMFDHPTGQSVMVSIRTAKGKVDSQTSARLEVSHTIDPNKYEAFIRGRRSFMQVGKSLDYLEPMLEKEMVEKIFKASGFDRLPLTDKARGVIEDAISRGAIPSTEYTGKIMVEHAMPEEPPAYARPGKDGLKVGDRVIPLQWMSAGRFGATFDLPYVPEAMKVKKLFVGPAKVSKNAYPPGKAPSDFSKVQTVVENRLWGMELESEEVSKEGEELCPCPVVTKDTTMVLRLEPLAQPTGEVSPQ